MRTGAALGLCAALAARSATGEPPSQDAQTKQLNERMARRAELMVTAHKLDAEVRRAWLDEAHTTPEIARLRARYLALQEELRKTQREIQEKVEALPAVAAKIKQRDDAKAEEQALSKALGVKAGE
jgi:chromosome segregation ATPase